VTIRPAGAADVEALAGVAARSYRFAFLPIIGEGGLAERRVGFFKRRFGAEWPSVRLLEIEGRTLGFHQLRDGRIDMLFVEPTRLGGGLGAALLADAEERGAVELECFRDNDRARRFYERHGWRLADSYHRDFAGGRYPFVQYRKG
jgi:putative acetyltransferase